MGIFTSRDGECETIISCAVSIAVASSKAPLVGTPYGYEYIRPTLAVAKGTAPSRDTPSRYLEQVHLKSPESQVSSDVHVFLFYPSFFDPSSVKIWYVKHL